MAAVTLRYWAGVRRAAGTGEEVVDADSIGAALALAREARNKPEFARVLSLCSLLVDGTVVSEGDVDGALSGPTTVEVLPPFAGGAGFWSAPDLD